MPKQNFYDKLKQGWQLERERLLQARAEIDIKRQEFYEKYYALKVA